MATTLALVAANLVAPELSGLGGLPGALMGSRAAIAAPVISTGSSKRAKLLLKTKLGKVPVFMVTNGGGSPFLNKLGNGDQSAVMFLFPKGAQDMLKAVLKAPNGASSGAKVLPSNLDRALKLAMLPPSASGLRDPVKGRELMMSWQFMPHAAEERAAALLKKGAAPKVPGYTAPGIFYKKHGRLVQPIFLAKKDADAAIALLPPGSGAKLQVVDLLDVLQTLVLRLELEDPAVEQLIQELELVPPSESMDFKAGLKSAGPKRAAKIFPPSHNR